MGRSTAGHRVGFAAAGARVAAAPRVVALPPSTVAAPPGAVAAAPAALAAARLAAARLTAAAEAVAHEGAEADIRGGGAGVTDVTYDDQLDTHYTLYAQACHKTYNLLHIHTFM